MVQEALRLLIRRKLEDGRLPRGSAPRAFGRPGNWQKCDACEEIITTHSLMMEVYAQTDDTSSVRFHGDCYILWNEEPRAAIVASRRSLRFPQTSHAAYCVACHGVRSHAVPVALVAECSVPVV
jgi:hypothetical protein